jgi:hypothetical protein
VIRLSPDALETTNTGLMLNIDKMPISLFRKLDAKMYEHHTYPGLAAITPEAMAQIKL